MARFTTNPHYNIGRFTTNPHYNMARFTTNPHYNSVICCLICEILGKLNRFVYHSPQTIILNRFSLRSNDWIIGCVSQRLPIDFAFPKFFGWDRSAKKFRGSTLGRGCKVDATWPIQFRPTNLIKFSCEITLYIRVFHSTIILLYVLSKNFAL